MDKLKSNSIDTTAEMLGKAAVEKLGLDQKAACIEYAMKEMGWSREEALRQIREARKRLDITYKQYHRYRLAKLDPEEQSEVVREKREQEAEAQEERENNFNLIMR